jgi:hypothetical protein
MTLNQIIGNRKTESKVDTELWKKLNEKYSGIENIAEEETGKNFVQKIKYNENGKPQLELNIIENTIVVILTQKTYDNLMQIYDAANWKWSDDIQSIQYNKWALHKLKTCFIAGKINTNKKISEFIIEEHVQRINYQIILFNKFCEIQGINQDTINKLNQYYDKNYPNRASKG